MIVSFETEILRDCCASRERADVVYGSNYAQELITVLADAEAAETASELIELYGSDAVVAGSDIIVTIASRYRLVLTAIGVGLVLDGSVVVDWHSVRRLKVKDILIC